MIAALYVETDGAYFGLPGVEPWDEARDARRYTGPHSVVAHPPCQRWGRFWHGSTRKPHQYQLGDDGGCFAAALAAVRQFGGVLEHPAHSRAWEVFFRLAEQFIARASQVATHGFAFLVRTSFIEGVGRYDNLFSTNPPSIVAQFSERVPMVKGRYDPKASTATSYCWLVWVEGEPGTKLMWIPPCRRQLERESDWPVLEVAA